MFYNENLIILFPLPGGGWMPLGKRSLMPVDDQGRSNWKIIYLPPAIVGVKVFWPKRSCQTMIKDMLECFFSGKRWRQTDGFWSPMGKRRRGADDGLQGAGKLRHKN